MTGGQPVGAVAADDNVGHNSQMLQQGSRLRQAGEHLFSLLELPGVYASPLAAMFHRMPQVQHLMKDDVLDQKLRRLGPVEDLAHDDGVVRRVEVAKHGRGSDTAPAKLWARHQAAEETLVEILEDLFEIVELPLRLRRLLAPADLSQQQHVLANIGPRSEERR